MRTLINDNLCLTQIVAFAIIVYFLSISKQADLGFEELLWIGQVLPLQCLVNTVLGVISGGIKIRSCESTEIHPTSSKLFNHNIVVFKWCKLRLTVSNYSNMSLLSFFIDIIIVFFYHGGHVLDTRNFVDAAFDYSWERLNASVLGMFLLLSVAL